MLNQLAAGPTVFNLSGRTDYVWDNTTSLLYISTNGGSILRYNPVNNSFLTPWDVGINLNALDITPDGRYLLAAESATGATQGFVRRIEISNGALTNFVYNRFDSGTGVFDIVALNDGRALFTLGASGSGNSPAIRSLDWNTGTVSTFTIGSSGQAMEQYTELWRSGDHSTVFMNGTNTSAGNVRIFSTNTGNYLINTNLWAPLNGFRAALNPPGTHIAMAGFNVSSAVNRTSDLGLINVLRDMGGGAAYDPTGSFLYVGGFNDGTLNIHRTSDYAKVGTIAIAPGTTFFPYSVPGNAMLVSGDGEWLFHYSDGKLAVYDIVPAPPLQFIWTGTTNNNWNTTPTDLNWTTAWSNNFSRNTPNGATFALPAPAAISVSSNIDVGSITFATGGWTLNPAGGALAFGGTGSINITTTLGINTINAPIVDGSTFGTGGGTTSLNKDGPATLVLAAPSTYTGNTTVNAGTLLANNPSGSATGTGNVTLHGGTLGGSGAITGNILPGSAPHRIHPGATLPTGNAATLTLGGLSTNPNTTLDFNLVTPGAASVNDLLNVTGLNALTINGGTVAFTTHSTGPGSLGYYKIIQYAGTIQGGGIPTLAMPAEINDVLYLLDTTHSPGFITVHKGFLGDANDDGTVTFNDFIILANNFGQPNRTWSHADFNDDHTTTFADFIILANNFGQSISGQSFAASAEELAAMEAWASAIAVPEPASLTLLAVAAALLALKRKT